jgi:hypothetical protein
MYRVEFENVKPSEEQIEKLFELLEGRLHRISYKETSYREHEGFVKSHPYRDWFLIKVSGNYVGSFYVSKENTIGINVSDEHTYFVVSPIINFVNKNFKPLPLIPSVRGDRFAINIPPSSTHLARALEAIDAKIAQVTYFLPS